MRAVPAQCDVAIVGGGYAGLSAALTLARAGRSVHLFERLRPGEGASTRNAGVASARLARGLTELGESHGKPAAQAAFQEAQEAWNALAIFIQDEGIPCDFEVGGALYGALWPHQLDHMAREAEFCQQHLGVDAHTVIGPQMADEIGSERYLGGLIRPDVATLNPARLHMALLALAMDAGVHIHGETGVTRIHQNNNGEHELQTMRGRTRTKVVVVASNGYGDKADPWLNRRIIAVPTGMIATEQLDANTIGELLPRLKVVGDTRRLAHTLRLSSDRSRILFSGLSSMGARNEDAIANVLKRELVRIFPQLEQLRVTHSWSGYDGYTRTRVPQIYNRNGIRYVVGFSGAGLVLSHWLGRKAAWQILGDERGGTVFAGDVPSSMPLLAGKSWFLPSVSNYLRMRDQFDQRGRNRTDQQSAAATEEEN